MKTIHNFFVRELTGFKDSLCEYIICNILCEYYVNN